MANIAKRRFVGALLRAGLLCTFVGVTVLGVSLPAHSAAAAAKKAKKKPEVPAVPPPAPPVPAPAAPAPPPPAAPPIAPTPPPVVPLRTEPEKPLKPTVADPVPAEAPPPPPTKPAEKPRKALWQGFFLSFDVGYGTVFGKDGPAIPVLTQGGKAPPPETPDMKTLTAGCPECYNDAVTTSKGTGVAAAIQIGYNIKGYVSLWADLSWHGSFGSKVDTAGAGTVAAMLGLHPLRFVRQDLPVDLRLYGGYGFFDILYYHEVRMQTEAKGKAWLGTALPFGTSLEYRFDDDGVFALGADLRFVQGSYGKWMYNYDKDIASVLTTPETTFRWESRLMFSWHF